MLQSREQIGKLDRKVTFIQRITVDGVSNEDKETGWQVIETHHTVFARKEEMGGNEVVVADRINYMQPTRWTVRWRGDVTPLMRLVWDTKVYQIIAVMEGEERKRYLKVMTNLLDNVFFT